MVSNDSEYEAAVALLSIAWDAKKARDEAVAEYDKHAAVIKAYLEREGSGTRVLTDDELGIYAKLTPVASHHYNVPEMPKDLVSALRDAGVLKVDHAALAKLDLPRLKAAVDPYHFEGQGTPRLTIDKPAK